MASFDPWRKVVILEHGGEAESARDYFNYQMDSFDRDELGRFLQTLPQE